MSDIDTMYTDRLLEHYRHPQRKGLLPAGTPDVLSAEEYNPLCGDRVTIQARIQDGRAVEVRFDGRGCALCLGAASILVEMMEGRPVAELQALDHEHFLAELESPIRPARVKCALLPWLAFRHALFGETDWPL